MNKFKKLIDGLENASWFCENDSMFDHQKDIDKAIEILQTLEQWCDAYPEQMFKPVDWPKVHKALEVAGVSGSAVAADCMRYTVNGFKKVLHDD